MADFENLREQAITTLSVTSHTAESAAHAAAKRGDETKTVKHENNATLTREGVQKAAGIGREVAHDEKSEKGLEHTPPPANLVI